MTPESDMKIDYAKVLQQLKYELDSLEGRRQALTASIAAIQSLVHADEQVALFPGTTARELSFPPAANGAVRLPVVPAGYFANKSPTEGYRLLMQTWPGHYTPPQIAGLFMDGGMSATTRTALIQAIHSVLKRERERKRAESASRL